MSEGTRPGPTDGTAAGKRQALRAMVEARQAALLPGAGNALTARAIEQAGFSACYVTGAGVANTLLGAPDLGLVTLTELADTVAAISDVCALPLVVDIDTGFGNALNLHRTMRAMERAGAAAVQLEDQAFPKRCGHFDGKAVIPLPEALAKLRAALDARGDSGLMVIARTDAAAVEGFESALERAAAFAEAGADMTFVEAPASRQELARVAALPVPQVANMVVGGRTPLLPQADLADMGFGVALYANAALQAAMRAMAEVLGTLKADGDVSRVMDRLAGFDERQAMVDKATWDALEARYRDG